MVQERAFVIALSSYLSLHQAIALDVEVDCNAFSLASNVAGVGINVTSASIVNGYTSGSSPICKQFGTFTGGETVTASSIELESTEAFVKRGVTLTTGTQACLPFAMLLPMQKAVYSVMIAHVQQILLPQYQYSIVKLFKLNVNLSIFANGLNHFDGSTAALMVHT